MTAPPDRRVLLVTGFMGVGKSTVGRRLAATRGAGFIDLDARIEDTSGLDIPTIFAREGEVGFRRREADALNSVLDASRADAVGPTVVALGGGALVDEASRRRALAGAFVVGLTASVDTILRRTRADKAAGDRPLGDRPLLQVDDPAAKVRGLLAARAHVYAEVHVAIATDNRHVDDVVADIDAQWTAR